MLKYIFITFFTIIILSCSESSSGPNENEIDDSNRPVAPDFTSNTLNNSTLSLDNYSGKVIYIFFLGSYCSQCRESGPTTNDIYKKYDANDLAVIGLDVWDGTSSQVSTFINFTGIEYPIGTNASQIGADYGVIRDYSVIIDKQGRIAFKQADVIYNNITNKIDELIKE